MWGEFDGEVKRRGELSFWGVSSTDVVDREREEGKRESGRSRTTNRGGQTTYESLGVRSRGSRVVVVTCVG